MAERRSFRAAAKELEDSLKRATEAMNAAQIDHDDAVQKLLTTQATYYALQEAYDLVKPKPRVRKAKVAKGGAA